MTDQTFTQGGVPKRLKDMGDGTYAEVVSAVMAAGSAVIGKAGSDNTTDGTTNRVVPPFTRSKEISGTLTPQASYSSGYSVGGLLTIATGLPAGTAVQITRVGTNVVFASASTNSAFVALAFRGAPAATFADGVTAPTLTAPDAAVYRGQITLGTAAYNPPGTLFLNGTGAIDLLVDNSGNIYIALIANGTETWNTPGVATWFVTLRY